MKLKTRRYGHGLPPLTILHGILGSSQNWHTIAEQFGHDRMVLVPDLRNHGSSPHGRHSIDAMCDDLLALLDDRNIKRSSLLGHSMGGLVAMQFAMRYPERLKCLIVEDVGPRVQSEGIVAVIDAMQSVDLDLVKSRQDAGQMLSEWIPDASARQFILHNLKRQRADRYVWQLNLPELNRFVREEHFALPDTRHFAGPVLFVVGGRSQHAVLSQEAAILRAFPSAEFSVIAGAGHWVHFEAQTAFMTAVTSFLAKHGA
jgi:pimeloyl-ACP methyl ester carboxylesterase